MLIERDYVCVDCGWKFEHGKKSILDSFPENGTLECPKCKSKNTEQRFPKTQNIIGEGQLGNSKNGYSKLPIYHPAAGRYKGTKTIKKY